MKMAFVFPKPLLEVVARLEKAGYRAYFVGGCVRDALLGKVPHDYDIASSATPDKVMELFSDCTVIPTGIKHGTVTLIYGIYSVELTSFRKEGGYTDNRHPDRVEFVGSIEEDTARRDFTVNALCYSPSEGVLDFHGGITDLQAGVIRCVGKAEQRFKEDALRILRALRFAARLDFTLEENTATAILEQKELIKNIAAERVLAELKAFFVTERCPRLAGAFLPVLCTATGAECPEEAEPLLKALRSLDGDCRLAYFFAYLGGSVDGARALILKLKPDTKTLLQVLSAAEAMYESCFDTALSLALTARRRGIQNTRLMYAVSVAEGKAFCTDCLSRLDKLEKGILPINPAELMLKGGDIKAIGVKDGKDIGKVLEHLYICVHGGTENTKEALTEEAIKFISYMQ